MNSQQRWHAAGFRSGLEAAAMLLERTAEDYMQMANQVHIPNLSGSMHGHVLNELTRKQAFIDKHDLLRGQVKRIRELQS